MTNVHVLFPVCDNKEADISQIETQTNDAINNSTLSLHEAGIDVNSKTYFEGTEVLRYLMRGLLELVDGQATENTMLMQAMMQNFRFQQAMS